MTHLFLFASVLLGGFYGGTGFFVRIGGNPAILRMSDRTFAEYWQHTDFFMADRMKIFGPLLLITLFTTLLIHLKQFNSWFFVSLMVSFLILIIDLIYAFSINHPLNRLIQSWDLCHLPGNVYEIKLKTVKAFYHRSAFMMISFFFLLMALFLKIIGQTF